MMERSNPRERVRNGPAAEKPYAFVPIPSGNALREHPTGHQQYRDHLLTGTFEGVIVARSPVHVASGQIELTGKQPSLVKAHFRQAGRLTIPGASLKGAIRSIVEAISHPPSCLRVTRAQSSAQPPQVRACNRQDSLCIACRMFGAMGYLGQVYFHDAAIEAGESTVILTPSLFAPRPRERTYYVGPTVKGRKFYRHGTLARGNVPLEVCPVGAQFRLQIDFVNLSQAQLGLLLVALGQGPTPLYPKLGGAKPVCCGSVEIQATELRATTTRMTALEYDTVPEVLDITTLAKETRLSSQEGLNALAHILAFPGNTACPGENY